MKKDGKNKAGTEENGEKVKESAEKERNRQLFLPYQLFTFIQLKLMK